MAAHKFPHFFIRHSAKPLIEPQKAFRIVIFIKDKVE